MSSSSTTSTDLIWNCALFSLLFIDPLINGIYFLVFRKLSCPANFVQGCHEPAVWRVAASMAILVAAPLCVLLPVQLQFGLDWSLYAVGYVMALIVVVTVVAPVLHYSRGATICQYLDERYDASRLRHAAAATQLVLLIVYASVMLAISGRIAGQLLPISPMILVPLFGYLAIFAVVFGGQSAAANANCFAPIAGTLVGLALLVYRGASLDAFNRETSFWTLSSSSDSQSTMWWAIVPASLLNGLHLMSASPLLYQHYFSLATRNRLRLALIVHGVLLLGIVALLIAWSAVFSHYLSIDCYHHHESMHLFERMRLAIGYFWSHQPGAVGFIVGGFALLGPATTASVIVSVATIVWEDLMRRRAVVNHSQIRQLCTLQMCTFALGTFIIIVAMAWLTLFDDFTLHAKTVLQTLSSLASPLTAVFICALFLPCTNGRGALFALTVGLLVTTLLTVGHLYENPVAYRPYHDDCDHHHRASMRHRDADGNITSSSSSSSAWMADINESLIGIVSADQQPPMISIASPTIVDYLQGALRLPATIHPIVGFAITLIACLIGSFATGGQDLFAMDWNLVVCTCIGTVERLTLKRQRTRRGCDYRNDRPRRPFVESDSFRYAQQAPLPDNTNYRNPKVHMYLANERTQSY